jgi:hypothetical protein
MKAWLIRNKEENYSTVVFAETRGKAKCVAMSTSCCWDVGFLDVEAYRMPHIDKYYTEGKRELDFSDTQDRIVLVKECGCRCFEVWEECDTCSAKEYCCLYQDALSEEKEKGGDQ